MKLKKLIFISLLITVFACKKDKPIPPFVDECLGANYDNYSTTSFTFIKQHLIGQTPFGPVNEFPDYRYCNAVFNPNNHYEITYSKQVNSNLGSELWKFSFCTGEAIKLADNFFYNLDWGSNGWLLYTGIDQQIYKVKENGDSLTQLTNQGGFNRAGKWNPSGTQFYSKDGLIMNSDGELIKNINLFPIDWITNDLVLISSGLFFNSYSLENENLIQLNSNQMSSTQPNIFDKENMNCYIPFQNGTAQDDFFIKYSLDGSNTTDTINKLYDSYFYIDGDIANDKIMTTLLRISWKDSITDTRYYRENIVIMDLDATNERLINLP